MEIHKILINIVYNLYVYFYVNRKRRRLFMKKFLSVFLALLMVFSTVAFAVPSAVTVTDTVEETASGEDAELMGAGYKVQRGINMLTGTKDALTGENYSTYGGLFNVAYGDTSVSASVNPKDENDKVFVFNVPGPAAADRSVS